MPEISIILYQYLVGMSAIAHLVGMVSQNWLWLNFSLMLCTHYHLISGSILIIW